MVVRHDLIKSLQAGQIAVAYAHEAWMQLEQLGADVMSIGRLGQGQAAQGFQGLQAADARQDGVASYGSFPHDLAVIVNSDNTRLSQLRNAYNKVGGLA